MHFEDIGQDAEWNERDALDEGPYDAAREREDDLYGVEWGDARRCPRHPGVKMSSDDGMFDAASCNMCDQEEAECNEAFDQGISVEELRAANEAARVEAQRAYAARLAAMPPPSDDDCPF